LLSHGKIIASNRKHVRTNRFSRHSHQNFVLTKILNGDFEIEEEFRAKIYRVVSAGHDRKVGMN
jgi:hypothetical protein